MQGSSVFLLTLTLAIYCSDGVAIVLTTHPLSENGVSVAAAQTSASHFHLSPAAQQVSADAQAPVLDPLMIRPHAGKGVDNVSFALRAMNFYGADLKAFTFKLDMVMSLKWKDPRVIALIPEGLPKLSMSHGQAEKILWMPGIVVSNRDIEKYEIISSSVTIYPSGEVHRVERANTRVMMKFLLEDYPFDSQRLALNIASSKYMLNEVRLVPDDQKAGVEENIWGLYDMNSWHTEAFTQHDGDLKKSRGSLVIDVKRGLDKYSQDHLWPSFIVLMISWAVFYFPFINQFIMARLALSILALLTFTNLVLKSTKELPGAAPFNWNDLFNQQIQTLMFITIVTNVASEIAFHQFHHEHLAKAMNNEAKILVPMLSIFNVFIIILCGERHWVTLAHAHYITEGVIVVFFIGYVTYLVRNESKMTEKEVEEDAEACKAGYEHDAEVAAISVFAVSTGPDDDAGDCGDC